jgi:hypothetical protein
MLEQCGQAVVWTKVDTRLRSLSEEDSSRGELQRKATLGFLRGRVCVCVCVCVCPDLWGSDGNCVIVGKQVHQKLAVAWNGMDDQGSHQSPFARSPPSCRRAVPPVAPSMASWAGGCR